MLAIVNSPTFSLTKTLKQLICQRFTPPQFCAIWYIITEILKFRFLQGYMPHVQYMYIFHHTHWCNNCGYGGRAGAVVSLQLKSSP